MQQIGPGMIQQIQSMCSDCQGQGEKFNSKDRCKTCNGHKVERKKKILEIHIDKGECLFFFFVHVIHILIVVNSVNVFCNAN